MNAGDSKPYFACLKIRDGRRAPGSGLAMAMGGGGGGGSGGGFPEPEDSVLFRRGTGESDDSDVWDDTALIKAYDKAVASFKV